MAGLRSFPYVLINAFLALGVCRFLAFVGWISVADVETVAVAIAFAVYAAPSFLSVVKAPPVAAKAVTKAPGLRPATAFSWRFRVLAHGFLGLLFTTLAALASFGLCRVGGVNVGFVVLFVALLPVVQVWCLFYALRVELSLRPRVWAAPELFAWIARSPTTDVVWAYNYLDSTRRHRARIA